MTTTDSTTTPRTGRRRLGVAALAVLLVTAGMTTAGTAARAAPDAVDGAATIGDCTIAKYAGTHYHECVVTDSGTIDLTTDIPWTMTPRDGDPVILTARGGDGATLVRQDGGSRSGGPGGTARTIATAGDIDELHLYVGKNAWDDSREGGSATVVSEVPIEDVTSIDDTYLVAGGGGAQGAWVKCWTGHSVGAGSGGRGGSADASRNDGDATGHGWSGGIGTFKWDICPPGAAHPGSGGDLGVGGTNPGDRRSDGVDGVGGHGGDNGWQGGVAAGHEAGRGGITGVWAMGGGGWGGGAGGERNAGGGGGGSYARAADHVINLPDSDASSPSVTIAWPWRHPYT